MFPNKHNEEVKDAVIHSQTVWHLLVLTCGDRQLILTQDVFKNVSYLLRCGSSPSIEGIRTEEEKVAQWEKLDR